MRQGDNLLHHVDCPACHFFFSAPLGVLLGQVLEVYGILYGQVQIIVGYKQFIYVM